MKTFECGTYAAAQAHARRGEPLDFACKAARSAYMRDYREKRPDALRQQKRQARLRLRALTRLADNHPREFAKTYAQVCAEERA